MATEGRAIFSAEEFKPFLGHVYEPAEDSFLLVDGVLGDMEFIKKTLKPDVCLEIGSGSGIVNSSFAMAMGEEERIVKYFATDINENAIRATQKCLQINNVQHIEVHHTNLADAIKNNISEKVDILVSNPPFEPCTKVETNNNKIGCAWTAGATGRMIINKIIQELPELMSAKGVVYMAMVKDNDIPDVLEQMAKVGFGNHKIIREQDGGTSSNLNRIYHQYVIRFSRSS